MSATSALLPTFEKLKGDDIDEDTLKAAAALFSANYGVWGPEAPQKMGSFAKPGQRVRMSSANLRRQCVPAGARNTYVRALIGDDLVGNVFACRWEYEGRSICWITQLVVRVDYRRQGLATNLLLKLQEDEPDGGFGILSSHPAAILAALRACGRGLEHFNPRMGQEHAREIMGLSPVNYVKTATLRGSLFEPDHIDGTVSSANTNFWVDHSESLRVLNAVRTRDTPWPFGELLEGHEYIALILAESGSTGET